MSEMDSNRRSPFTWLFQASLMLLGTAIALQLAICYLEPIWPYIAAAVGIGVLVWLLVAIARWRHSRW